MIMIDVSKYVFGLRDPERGFKRTSSKHCKGEKKCSLFCSGFCASCFQSGPEAPPWDDDSCVVDCLSVNLNGLVLRSTNKLRHPRDPHSLFPFFLLPLYFKGAKTNR